jgi:hypothetical protein
MQDRFGTFEIDYMLRTNAQPGFSAQFGMDFTLTTTKENFALCQLIHPCSDVGTNRANQWNIDNHWPNGPIESLYFNGAQNGRIFDTPTEIRPERLRQVHETRFAVFMVNKAKGTIIENGVTFGYRIDLSVTNPSTTFIDMNGWNMNHEQKALIIGRYPAAKFQKL